VVPPPRLLPQDGGVFLSFRFFVGPAFRGGPLFWFYLQGGRQSGGPHVAGIFIPSNEPEKVYS